MQRLWYAAGRGYPADELSTSVCENTGLMGVSQGNVHSDWHTGDVELFIVRMAAQFQGSINSRRVVPHSLGRPTQQLHQLHLSRLTHPVQPAASATHHRRQHGTRHAHNSSCRPQPMQRSSMVATQAAACWGLFASATLSSSSTVASAATYTLAPMLTSVGIFILCSAAAAFLVCAIPTLWAAARLAHQATAVLRQVEKELPETAALIRLSGLEVTDCVTELTGLGSDLSQGVRSAAKLVTVTESSVKQAVAVGQSLPPVLAAKETEARGVLEAGLRERAKLKYNLPEVVQAAKQTTGMVRRLRFGLAIASAASSVVRLGQVVRGRAQLVAQQYAQLDDPAASLPVPASKQ